MKLPAYKAGLAGLSGQDVANTLLTLLYGELLTVSKILVDNRTDLSYPFRNAPRSSASCVTLKRDGVEQVDKP